MREKGDGDNNVDDYDNIDDDGNVDEDDDNDDADNNGDGDDNDDADNGLDDGASRCEGEHYVATHFAQLCSPWFIQCT